MISFPYSIFKLFVNDKEINTKCIREDIKIDNGARMLGTNLPIGLELCISYLNSDLRIPISDFRIVKEGDLTALSITTKDTWAEKLKTFLS